jgi:hypothetical protein
MQTPFTNEQRFASQRGQTFLIIAVFITFFLLAVMGLATDYGQVWAHRQIAQAAADAACEAGAADLFLVGTDPTATTDFPGLDFTWIGSTYDCSAKPNSVPCKYAALNGYSGANVNVTFPASLPGVPAIPAGFGSITNPYIRVSIADPVPMLFTKLALANPTFTISAAAGCGLHSVTTPVPLVVLHRTAPSSLSVQGAALIKIFGGPQRSIQVDSSSSSAAGVGHVDLSAAGPSSSGSDFAVFGGPASAPGGVLLGSTGHYLAGANPFGDPFASVAAPPKPSTVGTATPVPFAINGCPDPSGCVEFTAGDYTACSTGSINPGQQGCLMLPYGGSNPRFNNSGPPWAPNTSYTVGKLIQPIRMSQNNPGQFIYMVYSAGGPSGPSVPALWNQSPCARQADGTCSGGLQPDGGITWQNVGTVGISPSTGIFDPGLYYLGANGLKLATTSTVRLSSATGDGNKGVTFYFSTSATVSVTSASGSANACTAASSGSATPNGCVVAYKKDGTLSPVATGAISSVKLQCPSGSPTPLLVPDSLPGNILLGPCGPTGYGSPDGNRGFLFFQNRATAASPSWGGGGSFLSSGFMYFHKGNGACGTGASCLTLQGGSGSQAYTLGNIVADEVALGGNPVINMVLNPAATFAVLRPSLLM